MKVLNVQSVVKSKPNRITVVDFVHSMKLH